MDQQVERPSTRRRIKLSSNSHWQVAGIGAIAGMALTALGLSPTGSAVFDLIVLASSAGFVAWAGCTAPWWLLVASSTIATAINPLGAGTVVGLTGIGLSVWIGMQQRSNPLFRALTIALVMVSLAFVGNLLMLGLSTAVGAILMAALVVTGLRRRPSADRRLATNIVGGVALLAIVIVAVAALSGYNARNNLRSANQSANRGLKAMRRADFETATTEFDRAAALFDQAKGKLSAPWVQPVRIVPIAAQQWTAATEVTNTAAGASIAVAENAKTVDLDRLKITNGQIDLAAIAELRAPLEEVQRSLADLDSSVAASQSPWLAPQIANRLDDLSADIETQQRLGDNALEATNVAPSILGAEGERRYLIMFTTPAEARGQGGFMGSYAEVTATNGKIEVATVGRTADLNVAATKGASDAPLIAAPSDWVSTWGQYLFKPGTEGVIGSGAWSNINMSAHFPNTAQVIDELYPNSGGRELDGVFSLDVYGIQELVGLVGPLQVEGSPRLTGRNTAQFILLDQYLGLTDDAVSDANAERKDLLGVIAEEGIQRLLSSNPPNPVALGTAFAPLAKEGRLLAWSADPAEEALFGRIGVDGALVDAPAPDDDDPAGTGIEVTVNNSLGNKIDSFLRRSTTVTGNTAVLTFTNDAPGSGLPTYVIGNREAPALPIGSNRMIVSIYSTEQVQNVMVDGSAIGTEQHEEAGRYIYRFVVTLSPGASTEISIVTPNEITAVVDQPLTKAPDQASEDSNEDAGDG